MTWAGPWLTRSVTSFDTGGVSAPTAETSGAIAQLKVGSQADGPAGRTTGRGSSFADACNLTNGAVRGPMNYYTDLTTATTLRGDTSAVDFWSTGQLDVLLGWPVIRGALSELYYTGSWPEGVTDVEYEWSDGTNVIPNFNDPSVLLSADVVFVTTVNRSTAAVPIDHPAAMTVDLRQTASTDRNWQPAATLSGYELTGSVASPASNDIDVTLTGTMDVAAAAAMSYPFTQAAYWHFKLHHHEQITAAEPATGSISGLVSDAGWGASFSKLVTIQVTGTFQPPRYRFVYDVAPVPMPGMLDAASARARASLNPAIPVRPGGS